MSTTSNTPAGPSVKLPQPATHFLGRQDELRQLLDMLDKPSCRLVTLLGPGGVGKTRLAIEAARQWADANEVEAAFVPLEAVSDSAQLVPEIASALGIRGIAGDDPVAHLARILGDRELLVLLDGFETVIDAASSIPSLLEGAPGLVLVVTSREALNLSSEWRFTVHGLPVPPEGSTDGDYGSVQLFNERAQRLDPAFSPANEIDSIARICRLVGGVPLAVELAASWTKSLSCSEIADEITSRIDFLATTMHDVPERHRSAQAVFDQCWQRLSDDLRTAFARLCVFSGGFDRAAAGSVAEADAKTLSTLVDRSLLWHDAGGRYHVHELLRQCARHHIDNSVADLDSARERHARYYIDFASRLMPDFLGGDQVGANQALGRDYDNLLAAIDYAVDHQQSTGLLEAEQGLALYHQVTGRYSDGLRLHEAMVEALETWPVSAETDRCLAITLVDLGWFCLRVGRIDDARKAAERAESVYNRSDLPMAPGVSTDPDLVLGVIALVEGDYDRAAECGNRSRARAEAEKHEPNLPYCHYVLAEAAYKSANYNEAREHSLRAIESATAAGDRWFEAYLLSQLGTIEAATGDLRSAQTNFQRSYDIRADFNDAEGMAAALSHLGSLELRQRNHDEALHHFEESRRLYRDLDDPGGRATVLGGLASALIGLDRPSEAAAYLKQALANAVRINFTSQILALTVTAASLLAPIRSQRAAELLVWVEHHPAADGDTVHRAQDLLESLPERPAQPPSFDVAAVVSPLEADLAEVERQPAHRDQPLVDPLSDREIEILAHIAEGRSNRQIAETLVLSLGTVKAHTHNIYGKLGAENRVQAVARAREAGLLTS